jgi:hypothetical protein
MAQKATVTKLNHTKSITCAIPPTSTNMTSTAATAAPRPDFLFVDDLWFFSVPLVVSVGASVPPLGASILAGSALESCAGFQ